VVLVLSGQSGGFLPVSNICAYASQIILHCTYSAHVRFHRWCRNQGPYGWAVAKSGVKLSNICYCTRPLRFRITFSEPGGNGRYLRMYLRRRSVESRESRVERTTSEARLATGDARVATTGRLAGSLSTVDCRISTLDSRHIASGAAMPSSANALASVWRVAAVSARRAVRAGRGEERTGQAW